MAASPARRRWCSRRKIRCSVAQGTPEGVVWSTLVWSTYGLATTLGNLFRARQRTHRGSDSAAGLLLLSGLEAGEGQRRPDCGTGNQSRNGEDALSQGLAVRAGLAERSACVAVPAAH